MTETEWLASDDPSRMLRWVTHGAPAESPIYNADVSDRKLRLFACAVCRQVWHLLTDERSRRAVVTAERFADGRADSTDLAAAETAADDLSISGSRALHPHRLVSWVTSRQHSWFNFFAANAWGEGVANLDRAASAALLREIVGNPFRAVTLPKPRPACRVCGHPTFVRVEGEVWVCKQCLHKQVIRDGEWVAPCPWLTPLVKRLAQAAYDERDFAVLPVLADALEDAGCADPVCEFCKDAKLETNDLGFPWAADSASALKARLAQRCVCKGTRRAPGILSHLRGPGPHVRGCWALDLLLGKV